MLPNATLIGTDLSGSFRIKNNRPDKLTLSAFIISTILAGNNAIAVRFSNVEFPPFFGAGLRFVLAGAILLIAVVVARLEFPTGRALIGALIFGTLQYGFSYALLYRSLLYVPAGLMQVLLALVPLITFFLAILHGQEKFEWRVLAGGLLGVLGIGIIFIDQVNADVPFLSLMGVVLAAAFFAEASVLFKSFPKTHPVTTNSVAMLTGASILFMGSLFFGESPTVPNQSSTWLALSYLVVFGSVTAFVMIFFVLKRWKASVANYQLVIMPIVTVISAYLILGEPITSALLLGGFFVLLGVYVGVLSPEGFLDRLFKRKS